MKKRVGLMAPLMAVLSVIALPVSLVSCKRGQSAASAAGVYVVGEVGGRATVWKDGAAQQLGGSGSTACAVQVSGNDVYVAGYVPGDSGPAAATWKNGKVL